MTGIDWTFWWSIWLTLATTLATAGVALSVTGLLRTIVDIISARSE